MTATTKKTISKPSQVERARERLEKAIARLEAALAAKPEGPPSGAEDIAQLTRQVAALEGDNARLSDLNKTVGDGLDGAIRRLKTVLEG